MKDSKLRKEVTMEELSRVEILKTLLELEAHMEGGYFRRTYTSETTGLDLPYGKRERLSSIYYLLTKESPVGHFHTNKSDILHFYHEGEPVTYYLLQPNGVLETYILGPELEQGQCLQLLVKGSTWKASSIEANHHGYSLISEAVSPSFDYDDMEIGREQKMLSIYPQHKELIMRLCKR